MLRVSSVRIVPPMSFEPLDGIAIGKVSREASPRASFPSRHACVKALNCQRSNYLLLQLLSNDECERQVHIVSAKENMVTDRYSLQLEFAIHLTNLNQGSPWCRRRRHKRAQYRLAQVGFASHLLGDQAKRRALPAAPLEVSAYQSPFPGLTVNSRANRMTQAP